MKFLVMIMIYLAMNSSISAVSIRVIQNASLMMNSSSTIINNQSTCNACLCAMLMSSGNSSILSLNCYINNNSSVDCELFTMGNYQIFPYYKIKIKFNSTLYFLQLPSPMTTTAGTTLYFMMILNTYGIKQVNQDPMDLFLVYEIANNMQ